MKANIINPFLTSVRNVMETMLHVKIEQSIPYAKTNNLASGDISGIISFTEKNCVGAVALSFPKTTALNVYNLFSGEYSDRLGMDVQDAVGEMANMVAGGAKTEFSKHGLTFHLSIPTIVVGQNHSINHMPDTPVIVIPMSLNGNSFNLEVSMKIEDHNGDRRIS